MNIISKPISALVALVLFSKIAAAAQADEFYNGLWASERRFCNTEGEDAPFEITRKEMFFYEYLCRIISIKAIGNNEWSANLSCQYDGPSDRRRLTLRRTEGDRLTIIWDNGATRKNFVRCR